MYQTKFGQFDGDSWEGLCQICLKQKFLDEGYQEIKASPGDLGIDGFTRTGRAFQCYCPDFNYRADDLYEKQRDKITKDLAKLETYQSELQDYLGEVKIKQWYFTSPESRKKEIVRHCKEKAEEYRKKGLPHLHAEFDVLFIDIDYFAKELPTALVQMGSKLELTCQDPVTHTEIAAWKKDQSSLVNNALRKHRARFREHTATVDLSVQNLTTNSVKDYLEGDQKLRNWEELHQARYERYQSILAHAQKRAEEKCQFPTHDCNRLLEDIRSELLTRLDSDFPEMDSLTLENLADYAIAKWILECPIDFR